MKKALGIIVAFWLATGVAMAQGHDGEPHRGVGSVHQPANNSGNGNVSGTPLTQRRTDTHEPNGNIGAGSGPDRSPASLMPDGPGANLVGEGMVDAAKNIEKHNQEIDAAAKAMESVFGDPSKAKGNPPSNNGGQTDHNGAGANNSGNAGNTGNAGGNSNGGNASGDGHHEGTGDAKK